MLTRQAFQQLRQPNPRWPLHLITLSLALLAAKGLWWALAGVLVLLAVLLCL